MSNVDYEKIIKVVQSSTSRLINSFQEKNILLKQYSKDIKYVIREGYDKQHSYDTCLKLFGKNKTKFIAIDGIESQDQHLDMLVFYAGAFGYAGEIEFSKDTGCKYKEVEELKGIDNVAAAISIHEEDSPSIAGQIRQGGMETDPERIPSSLMQLAEYYFAVKSILINPSIQIVILDRTLAGDVAHLVWSIEDLLESGRCILNGIVTEYGKVTSLDLELARILHPNGQLGIPIARSHLIKYAAINQLLKLKKEDNDFSNHLTYEDLLSMIGGSNKRIGKLKSDLLKLDKKYSIFNSGYKNLHANALDTLYWERIFSASLKVCEHIFNTPEGKHPLIFEEPTSFGKRCWITISDIDYLVLMMIYALLRLAWEKNVLVIGLVKDIAASEMAKTIIPLLKEARKIREYRLPEYGSDKALLQTASIINFSDITAPWNTFEFDSCFRTISPILNVKNNPNSPLHLQVKGAFKNVISSERMFLKSYLQLWQSDNDPSVKSHVFSYDRPCYPGFDITVDDKLELYHEDGQVVEKIHPIIHFDNRSNISHIVMDILCAMSSEVIPECLGHNYPLFLADKKAKALLQEGRRAYMAAVSLELAKSRLDQQVLFERSYREYRSQLESTRRRS